MTALVADVRELTFDEIDFVSGGDIFGSIAEAARAIYGAVAEAVQWLLENFTVTVNSNGTVTVTTRPPSSGGEEK